MADIADIAQDRIDNALSDNIAAARGIIPPGIEGECDDCGEHSFRLIKGECAICRDRTAKHARLNIKVDA